jgi:hypothetical protein
MMSVRTNMPAKGSATERLPAPVELVARRIFVIRGQRVMLDSDLAQLYEVETKVLNRAVKRHAYRFPDDFMFQLTEQEVENLRCQFGTSSSAHGGRRYFPFAFTELGVAMLSSVLNSVRAVQMNITVMRAFVRVRDILASNRALAQRVEQLTATVESHEALFEVVIKDIESLDHKVSNEIRLLKNPRRRKARIGFHVPAGK